MPSRWHLGLVLPCYALVYALAYGLGRVLYLEPASISALWPASGLALGVLLLAPRRWWLALLAVQTTAHLILATIDVGIGFAVGVTAADVIETVLAAVLIRRWCDGPLRLEEPAHIGRFLAGTAVAVLPAALIGTATVHAIFGSNDLFVSVRIWLLADLIGILVVAPAVVALASLHREWSGCSRVETLLAFLVMIALTALVGFSQSDDADPWLRPSLAWIPLLWLGLRAGPASTAVGAAAAILLLVAGADLGRGPFAVEGRDASGVSLGVQIFSAILGTGTLLIAASATGRRHALAAASATAERLRTTLASIGDGVIATDIDGRVVLLNAVATDLTGWTETEAKSRPLSEVFSIVSAITGEPAANPVERALREGVIVGLANHTELIHRDGSRRQIADSGAPIRNTDGSLTGAVLVFRDVTERYRLEDRLRQTEKLEAIGRLSSGIAHDLNNMLGGVLGGAELLRGRIGSDERLTRPLDLIVDSGERMRELNARLLAFARREPAARQAIDIDELIGDCAELLRHALTARCTLELDCRAGAGVKVEVDAGQFQSALLNLAVNGRDAMTENGVLRIASELRHTDDRNEVAVIVQDSGCGMPPDVLARATEPFFTTKPRGQGTGLGLHAVQTCIQAHGGTMAITSAPGQGTTVTVILPQARSRPPSGPVAMGLKRILLVDDDAGVREATTAQLEDNGCTVVTASDGVAGLAALRDQGPFDAVILDVVMPRMDGLEMLRELRRSHPRLPVALVSGRLPEVDISDLVAQGPTVVLAKPYRLAELRRLLDEVRGMNAGP